MRIVNSAIVFYLLLVLCPVFAQSRNNSYFEKKAVDSSSSTAAKQKAQSVKDSIEDAQALLCMSASSTINPTVRTSNRLSISGSIMHYTGTACVVFSQFWLLNADDETQSTLLTLSYAGRFIQKIGPILSCVGASKVERELKKSGCAAVDLHVWRQFGTGLTFRGTSFTLQVLSTGITAASGEESFVIPFLIGALACDILAEVQWSRCVYDAQRFITKKRKLLNSSKVSLQIIPQIDLNGKYGALCIVGLY